MCYISNAAASLAMASIQVDVAETLWPLWDDAILVGSEGTMRSARLGVLFNATNAVLAAAAASGAGQSAASVVLQAARSLWSGVALSNTTPSNADTGFTITLVGASRIVLRGPAGFRAFASGATSASIGGILCNVSAISDDGAWAVVDTPSPQALCGSDAVDCGYVPLELGNAPGDSLRGASLICPPFCAGAVSGAIVPVAVKGDEVFGLGLESGTDAGPPSLLPSASATTSEGVYYSARCTQV